MRRESRLGAVAGAVGKGLLAGLAGTLAMTAGQMVEMKLRGRQPSSAPSDAAGKVLGVQPVDEAAKARFSQMVHFGYGTGWGAVRGLIDAAGIEGPAATLLHFVAIFVSGLVMLPALDVAPPVKEWGAIEIAVDALHHVVYAVATAAAYDALS